MNNRILKKYFRKILQNNLEKNSMPCCAEGRRKAKYWMAIYLCFFSMTSFGQDWKQYQNVEQAGFSAKALKEVKTKLENTNTASLLVVHDGNILMSYGDNTRKYMLHSIRKSIMNAMIGIEIENGSLTLNQTLQELNIDDIGQLTKAEREATLQDLLSARSGVFHPSAYSPRGMSKNLPERGSHIHGTFWYYNNWDFNTLLTIYEQQSGKRFFEAFKREIADPIGMEDFRIGDTYYRIEKDKSIHPAYLFRMSARDMARFGLLYLKNGYWHKKQIVPSDWVKKSTRPVSTDLGEFSTRETYGLLWWVAKINDKNVYYASGTGGHRIMVFPNDDMVIVHRVNTYNNKSVNNQAINEIVSGIFNARQKRVENTKPTLFSYNPPTQSFTTTYSHSMDEFLGTFKHRFLGKMTIKMDPVGYVLQNGVGVFRLYPTSQNSFFSEDLETPIVMKKATDENQRFTIEPQFDSSKSMTEVVFYY